MRKQLVLWLGALTMSMLAWSGSAFGQATTFLLGLQGSGNHFPLPSECEPQPVCPPQRLDWTGTVRIVTAGSADGVHAGGDLLALDVTSNQVNFTLDRILGSVAFFGDPPPSVTLADQQVVSVNFTVHLTPDLFLPAPTVVTFSGLSGGFFVPVSHRLGSTNFFGTLVPIPEPGPWALLLAGTGMLAFGARRRMAAESCGSKSSHARSSMR